MSCVGWALRQRKTLAVARGSLSVSLAPGWFSGDPRKASYEKLMGSGADVSVNFEAVGAGGWIYTDRNGAASWWGYSVGFGPGAGASYGHSNSTDGW